MKSSLIEGLVRDIKDKSIPFYKKKLFFISIGIILFALIIIIIVAATSKSDNFYSSDNFKESILFVKNPDQGFHNPETVIITPTSLTYYAINPEQLYHILCDISQFSKAVNGNKDMEFTQTALDKLDEFINNIKINNKNVVIRFSYDPKYEGNKNKEASMEMMETHIKQLSHVLNKYYHTITAIEAGMIGPWGEMHSSDVATETNKAKILKIWLENTNNIPILARTPNVIFEYFGKNLTEMEKSEIKNNDKGYLLGIFNDCFLSSKDDYGTYKFNRTREIDWLSKQNEHLPFGGETCNVYSFSDLDYAISEMYKLHLSFLNIEHKPEVISKWKNINYDSKIGKDSIFYGVSGFDYIKSHMGYRLVIRSFNIKYVKGDEFELKINIDNVGFGNLIKQKKVDIIYTNISNEIISRKNIGIYNGEKELKVNGEFLPKEHELYKVFIKIYGMRDNNIDYYFIQFANEDIFDEKLNSTYLFNVLKGGEVQR